MPSDDDYRFPAHFEVERRFFDRLYRPNRKDDEQLERQEAAYLKLDTLYHKLLYMPTTQWFDREMNEAARQIVALHPYPDDSPLPEFWQPLFVHALVEAAKQARTTQDQGYDIHVNKEKLKKAVEMGDESPPIEVKHVSRPEGFIPAELPFSVSLNDSFLTRVYEEEGQAAFVAELLAQYSETPLFWVRQRTSEILKKLLKDMLKHVEHDVKFVCFPGRRGRKKGVSKLGATPAKRKALLEDGVSTVMRNGWPRTWASLLNALNKNGIKVSQSNLRKWMNADGMRPQDIGLFPC